MSVQAPPIWDAFARPGNESSLCEEVHRHSDGLDEIPGEPSCCMARSEHPLCTKCLPAVALSSRADDLATFLKWLGG